MPKQKISEQETQTDPGLLQTAIRQLLEQISKRDQTISWEHAQNGRLTKRVEEIEPALRAALLDAAGKEQSVQALTARLAELERSVQALSARLAEEEQEQRELRTSEPWKTAVLLRQVQSTLAPDNSFRGKVAGRLYQFTASPFLKILIKRNTRNDLALIRSSGLFDAAWYLAKNPDVARAKIDPALHYLNYGGFEGRDPGPDFSSNRYFETYRDVKNAGINPLIHYLKYGKKEGRVAS